MGFKPGKGELAGDFSITTGSVLLKEMGTAGPDTAAYGQIWVKSNDPCDLFFTDDSGQDVRITNDGSLASSGGSLSGLGSTDNAVARANGTGGETIQGSSVIISDAGVVSGSSYEGYATRTTTVEVTSVSASSAQAATLSGSAATLDNLTLGNTAVTSDAGELNLLDGAAAETIANSKAVIYGNIGEVTGSTFKGFSVQAADGLYTAPVSASLFKGSNVSASTEITGGWHRGHTLQGDSGIFTVLSGSTATVENVTVKNTGRVTGSFIDHNYAYNPSAVITALEIDVDKITATTSSNLITGIKVDLDNTTATNGTNTMIGGSFTPTLTHAADAGTTLVKGLEVITTAGTNGTSTARGIEVKSLGGDYNQGLYMNVADGGVDIKLVSSADTGDFFSIETTTHGATTITTLDDNAAAANLIFEIDGNYKVDAAGIVKLDSDTGDIYIQDGGTTMLLFDLDSTSGSIGADLIFKVEDDAKNLVFQQSNGAEIARIQHTGSLPANVNTLEPGFGFKRPVAEIIADGGDVAAALVASMSGYIISLVPATAHNMTITLPAGLPGMTFDFWVGEAVNGSKTIKIKTAGADADNNDNFYGHFNVPGGSHAFTTDFTGDILTIPGSTAKGGFVRVTCVLGGSNEIWHAETITSVVCVVDTS